MKEKSPYNVSLCDPPYNQCVVVCENRDQCDKMKADLQTDDNYWPTCLDDDGDWPMTWGNYFEGCDFAVMCRNGEKVARQIFKSMPEGFRESYFGYDSDDPSVGYFIKIVGCTSNLVHQIEKGRIWQPPAFEVVTLGEVARAKIETRHLIKGLLGEKESLVIVGPSGIGKSLLVNFIGFASANYSYLWDTFKIERPVTSLVIQSENDYAPTKDRINKLFQEVPEFSDTNRVFIQKIFAKRNCRMAGNIVDPEFQKRTVDALQEVGADLLFLDPLISYHGESENDNSAMRYALDCLQEKICDVADVSVILTHHYNKMGKSRGASAIRDWAANVILLELEKIENQSAIIKIFHDKARNYPQQDPFYLERTPGLNFVIVEEPGTKADTHIQAVVGALVELGGQVEKQTELLEPVQKKLNCKLTLAKRAVSLACEKRKIVVVPSVKGNATGYRLPEKA